MLIPDVFGTLSFLSLGKKQGISQSKNEAKAKFFLRLSQLVVSLIKTYYKLPALKSEPPDLLLMFLSTVFGSSWSKDGCISFDSIGTSEGESLKNHDKDV